MSKFALSDFTLAIELIMRHRDFKTVTVFCSPLKNVKKRVRASWQHKRNKYDTGNTILVTIGKPNYKEREFLKQCKKAKCLPRKWKAW